MRERATAMTEAIVWAGTFHAIGARLLREYAEAFGRRHRNDNSSLLIGKLKRLAA
jgi:superfamily I DNA/RNA helicase